MLEHIHRHGLRVWLADVAQLYVNVFQNLQELIIDLHCAGSCLASLVTPLRALPPSHHAGSTAFHHNIRIHSCLACAVAKLTKANLACCIQGAACITIWSMDQGQCLVIIPCVNSQPTQGFHSRETSMFINLLSCASLQLIHGLIKWEAQRQAPVGTGLFCVCCSWLSSTCQPVRSMR